MGFFKKIGSTIKKNVSFKNIVKVTSKFGSFIPIIGGPLSSVVGTLSDNHESKKFQRQQNEQQSLAQADYDKALQLAQSQGSTPSEAQKIASDVMVSRNPNIREVLTAGAGGALTSIGNVLGGSSTIGNTGATIVDSTISSWLKKNWLKMIGFILGSTTIIFIFIKILGNKSTKYRRR